jgi:hypothetical protein
MISFNEFLEEKIGLWDRIHAKRARIKAGSGEHMRKPGSEGAPTKQNFIDAQESAAWQRKEGKDPAGGLNAKGRASYNRANPGKPGLKPPAPNPKTKKDAARRKSFCARMSGMPGPMKDDKGRPTRKALSLKAWNC